MTQDDRELQGAQALVMMDEEMVYDTEISESRVQRDECYMLLMRALASPKPLTTAGLEKITLRSGIPLLMLPNGWYRVNELSESQYGLQGEYAPYQRWSMRPEFKHLNPYDMSVRELGDQVDSIFEQWDPENLMSPEQTRRFYNRVADLQHKMVHKTVAKRVGIIESQLDGQKKAKIEDVVRAIQMFLRAGVPDPFQVQEIQKAIAELRADPFAMDAMKLLVEDMGKKAIDEFAIDQLTAILGELNVTVKAENNGQEFFDGSDPVETESCSSEQLHAGQVEDAGEMQSLGLAFRGR